MDLHELTDKAIDDILAALEGEMRMSDWEKNFIESISNQWERNRSLSDNQKLTLGKIWDKY